MAALGWSEEVRRHVSSASQRLNRSALGGEVRWTIGSPVALCHWNDASDVHSVLAVLERTAVRMDGFEIKRAMSDHHRDHVKRMVMLKDMPVASFTDGNKPVEFVEFEVVDAIPDTVPQEWMDMTIHAGELSILST